MTAPPPRQPPRPATPPPTATPLPTTNNAERRITKEEIQHGIELLEKFAEAHSRLGRAERAWHIAAVEHYRCEGELAKYDAELRQKYSVQPDETFDFSTGLVIKRE